jgi:orotidine-5'-phosphate decarboxylase
VSWLACVKESVRSLGSFVCVGLDPDLEKLPPEFAKNEQGVADFCLEIVRLTAPHCSAFKPQFAHFAGQDVLGALKTICHEIRRSYPQHHLILDAKRGDIGSTAFFYAKEAFEIYQAHACTIHPYMGFDSVEPYLTYQDRGIFLLCRTSNETGKTFQNLRVVGESNQTSFLFEKVAGVALTEWNVEDRLGLVMGATNVSELSLIRDSHAQVPFLIPGIGAQGGELSSTVNATQLSWDRPSWINSSRAILYASTQSGETWREACVRAAFVLNRDILALLPSKNLSF